MNEEKYHKHTDDLQTHNFIFFFDTNLNLQ